MSHTGKQPVAYWSPSLDPLEPVVEEGTANRGILVFGKELLLKLCGLPADTDIRGARLSFDGLSVELCIEHPGLKPVGPGAVVPFVNAELRRGKDGWPEFISWTGVTGERQ